MKSSFSVTFIIQKGKLRVDGTVPIMARVIVNKRMTHIATKQYIRPDRWLPEEHRTRGCTKEEKEINDYLTTFKTAIQKRYLGKMLNDESLSAHSLKSSVLCAPTKGKPTDIMPLCDCFI